jgi:hypothetical protein
VIAAFVDKFGKLVTEPFALARRQQRTFTPGAGNA